MLFIFPKAREESCHGSITITSTEICNETKRRKALTLKGHSHEFYYIFCWSDHEDWTI